MTCCQTGGFYEGPMYQMGGFYAGPRFQRGGAIRGFAGPEYQIGGKWNFGQFLWRHAKPLLSYLGKKALSTGVGIGQDVLEGQNVGESAKKRITSAGKDVAVDALDRVKEKIQAGKGRRRIKRKKAAKRTTVKRKRRTNTAPKRKRVIRRAKPTRRTKRKPSRRRTVGRSKRRVSRRRQPTLRTIFD